MSIKKGKELPKRNDGIGTYSKKYGWYQESATFIDLQYFQAKMQRAAREHK